LGDSDGTSLGVGIGVLRDVCKETLAYGPPAGFEPADVDGDPVKVRWERATSKPHAETLLEEHR